MTHSKIEFVIQPLLLITSSEKHEKSVATVYGSIFTRYLFKELEKIDKNRNLTTFIENISINIRKMYTGYPQTVSVYSSYVIDPILFTWIQSHNKYDIVTDMSGCVLVLRNIF